MTFLTSDVGPIINTRGLCHSPARHYIVYCICNDWLWMGVVENVSCMWYLQLDRLCKSGKSLKGFTLILDDSFKLEGSEDWVFWVNKSKPRGLLENNHNHGFKGI